MVVPWYRYGGTRTLVSMCVVTPEVKKDIDNTDILLNYLQVLLCTFLFR